jgi:hypothetical protein
MKSSVKHKRKGTNNSRDSFILRTAKDTVVSFSLEGIKISLEDAIEMAKKAVAKVEKEGKLTLS